jgi:DNA-binding CsgD family transcriptional regulator
MGNTHLRVADVRELLRLIGEVRELGAEPRQWREHMLSSLSRLCGAKVSLLAEAWLPHPHSTSADLKRVWSLAEERAHQVSLPGLPVKAVVLQMVDVGFSNPTQRDAYYEFFFAANYHDDPSFSGCLNVALSASTAARQEFITDGEWYQSPHVNNQCRLMDLDNYVCSAQRIGDTGCMSIMGFYRPFGDRPFSERETALVRVFHEELGRLWSHSREALPSRFLTPRLRDTLRHLLAGLSEKEIADVLTLSRQTVHDYVKALYRRYGVGSRSQLHVARTREIEALRRRPALISDALCE